MNNKGMTLVELLVTFSLLMIIVVGMFNLILDTKLDLDNKKMGKAISEYSNFANSDIHYELITKQPLAIAIKITSSGEWNIKYNTEYDHDDACGGTEESPIPCGITNNVFRVNSSIKEKNINITGEKNATNMCSGFYPCAIYVYYDKKTKNGENTSAIFKSIAINTLVNGSNKFGIKYNNVFEELPYYDYVDIQRTQISMKFESEYFVIDYPVYFTDNDINYGFKIAYPVSGIAKTEKVDPEENPDDGEEPDTEES